MHSVVLATRILTESQTGEAIAEMITKITDEFKINNPVGLTTDGASNMKVAAKCTKLVSVLCFAHTLQLGVNDGLTKVRQVPWQIQEGL